MGKHLNNTVLYPVLWLLFRHSEVLLLISIVLLQKPLNFDINYNKFDFHKKSFLRVITGVGEFLVYLILLEFTSFILFYSQTEVLENRFVSSRYKFWCIYLLLLSVCQNGLWKSTFGCFELGVDDKLSDRDKYNTEIDSIHDYNLTLSTFLWTSFGVPNSHYRF